MQLICTVVVADFLLISFKNQKMCCLEVNSYWKFSAVHSTSGNSILYGVWSKLHVYVRPFAQVAHIYTLIWILTNYCILLGIFCVNFSAVADADSKSCFNYGESVGRCHISEF